MSTVNNRMAVEKVPTLPAEPPLANRTLWEVVQWSLEFRGDLGQSIEEHRVILTALEQRDGAKVAEHTAVPLRHLEATPADAVIAAALGTYRPRGPARRPR